MIPSSGAASIYRCADRLSGHGDRFWRKGRVIPNERRGREQLSQGALIILPAGDGLFLDGLSDLGDAGRADRTVVAVEFQAGGDQPRHRLEVVHRLFVIDMTDRRQSQRLPAARKETGVFESDGLSPS